MRDQFQVPHLPRLVHLASTVRCAAKLHLDKFDESSHQFLSHLFDLPVVRHAIGWEVFLCTLSAYPQNGVAPITMPATTTIEKKCGT